MANLNLPNIREGGDIRFRIGLEDGGVAVDWSGLEDIRVFLYADAQKRVSGECEIGIDVSDHTVLGCFYSGDDTQYRGINSVLVRAKYQGEIKVYDKPAINIVARTADATGVLVIDDPVVPVQISVEDVSTSLLNNAIDAAINAAADAEEAAHLVPLQVLEDCVEATGKALEAASKAPYIDETTGHWFVWDAEAGEYVDSGKQSRGATGNGIASWSVVESAEDAGNNVVTVTFTDGTSESFNVKNGHTGNGIASIVQTVESPDDAGTNVITITMTNGTVVTFNVKNGSKGTPGVAQAAYKSVDTLPTASAATMDKIYLTPSGTSGVYNMSYTEFDGSAYSWQDLGTTAIQLSDYATKAELSQLEHEVTDLEDGLVLSDTIRKELTDAPYLANMSFGSSSPHTIFPASGYNIYYLPIKNGQTIKARFSITAGSCNVGYTATLPADGVEVTKYSSVNHTYHENSVTADADGYFVCRFDPLYITSAYFEITNTGFGKTVKDAIAVVADNVELIDKAVNPSVKYIDISTRMQRVKGYATANGQWKGIGTANWYFIYVPVESGKTYRFAGTYSLSANSYADMLFSDVMPVTDAYGTVIEANKADGSTFDVTYTASSNGYVFIWVRNDVTYYDSFFIVSQVSRLDGFDKNDADIKEAINYTEETETIGNLTSIKGYVLSTGAFTKINDESSAITMQYFPVTAGTAYRIQGTHGTQSGYGSIIFSESVPVTGDFGIIIKASVANASFDVSFTPDLDGYIFVYADPFQVTTQVPEQKMMTKDLIFSDQFSEQIKLVGVAYQQKYVVKSTHTIMDASSNGSFIISVLEGERYFIRAKVNAFANYALVAFSDSLTADYSAGCVVLKSVNADDGNYEYTYNFTAPSNGYLIVWSTVNVYGSTKFVEIFRLKERLTELFDRYLPESVKIQTFGDSITDNNWGDYSSWVSYIPDNIKNTTLTIVNSAVGGAGIGGNGSYNIPHQVTDGYTRDDGSIAAPLDAYADIVVILAGTNDYAAGQTIASVTGNLATTFQYIFEHSKAKVLFCTPLQRYNTTDQNFDTDSDGVPVNSQGYTLRQLCDEIIKICRRFSVSVLDLNAEANINRYNILDYSLDGLHPQRWGDAYVSRLICQKIKEMMRYELQ